jgi:hypothetical protein
VANAYIIPEMAQDVVIRGMEGSRQSPDHLRQVLQERMKDLGWRRADSPFIGDGAID